ncbi:DUF418 domain-containing protein [Pseudomonas sp. CGJS7]|uniref:DUF418 domain-containing protein n=1 Tax=Pseudomonas sp. CGJS7 TaxID=3109348 RepID=UPI00300A2AA0
MSAKPAPRIELLDALRGLALLGILLVNIGVFASPWWGLGAADPGFDRPLDHAVHLLVACVFEMKFYLLFSFLFGYSFSLQLEAARRAGEAFAPRMRRRLLGLWVIGALHAALLFHGDILTTYAAMGAVLLALHRLPRAKALRWARGLIAATALVWAGLAALVWIDQGSLFAAIERADDLRAQADAVLTGFRGDPAQVIGARLRELSGTWLVLAGLQAPCALAMFLYGLAAGRRRLFARPERYRALLRRARTRGLAIGLPAAALFAWATLAAPGSALELFALALSIATAPWLCLAYLAIAVRAFAGRRIRRAASALAPAGRMALSNYLLQSLILALLFTGYGLGWMGRISPLSTVALATVLYAAQLCLSRLWLRRYAYGPVEWGLRALTIGAWPRMRKSAREPR